MFIKKILFNGKKAEAEFKKRIVPEIHSLCPHIKYAVLPSTSPAMASLSKYAKLAEWKHHLKLKK